MDIRATYEGSGFVDPMTEESKFPVLRIAIQGTGLPNQLDVAKVQEWLRTELVIICSILCSYVLSGLYASLVNLNNEYRAQIKGTINRMCNVAS